MKDWLSSLIIMVFALLACYLSYRLSLWQPDGNPGDGLFPFLASLALYLLAQYQFITCLARPRRIIETESSTRKVRLLIYIGSVLAYALLFEWLGFTLATFFFLLSVCRLAEKADWKTSLTFALAITGIGFFIFYYGLQAPLPFGILKMLPLG